MDSAHTGALDARLALPQPLEGPWYARSVPIRYIHVDPLGAVHAVRLLHGLVGKRKPPVFKRVNDALFELAFNPGDVHRVEYEFELQLRDGSTQVMADPMNPVRVGDPFSEKSVTLLNGYTEPLHCRPPADGTRGQLRRIDVRPLTEGGPGFALAWEPPGVSPGDVLPLLVVLDGGDYVRYARLPDLLANMMADGEIAPSGVRAVFLAPGDRYEEYAANPDMPRWLHDLLTEQLPGQLRVPAERDRRFALGASLGGLCLLHAQVTVPELFGGFVLQSGSFFQPDSDWMESKLKRFGRICGCVSRVLEERPAGEGVKVAITCGIGEENIVNNRRMAARLDECGYAVRFTGHPDAHNWTSWRNCVGGALAEVLKQS